MADFTFCPNGTVPETLPREASNTVTFGGWKFTARPTSPIQRAFRVRLHGLRWYLNTDGTYDKTTNPTINAAALEEFYSTYEQWAPFTWVHPHLGLLTVKFNAPLAVPAGQVNAGGLLEPLEIMLVETGAWTLPFPYKPARQWRLQFTGSNGGSFVGAAEVEFALTTGGADQVTGGTASAFSSFSGLPATNAFDNNNATEWASNGDGLPNSQYLAYDFGFGVTKDINSIRILPRAGANTASQSATGFKVQYSHDGVIWYTRWTETGITGWTAGVTKTFNRPL